MKVYIAEILVMPNCRTATKEQIERDLKLSLDCADLFSYGCFNVKDAEVVLCED